MIVTHIEEFASATRFVNLDQILARRIMECFKDIIPEEQYGFMPGKSTIDAAKKFYAKITETVTGPGTKLFAIFIDLTKAFDLSDRTILFNKIIEKKKLSKTELNLLSDLLDIDFISINDGISKSEPPTLTTIRRDIHQIWFRRKTRGILVQH
jgi:hypothetical protein